MPDSVKTPLNIELRHGGRMVLVKSIVHVLDEQGVVVDGRIEDDLYVAHSETVHFDGNRILFRDTVFPGTRVKLTVQGEVIEYPEDPDADPVTRQEVSNVDYTFTEVYTPGDAAGIIAGEIGLAEVVSGYEDIEIPGQELGVALILADSDGNPVEPTGKGLDFPPSSLPDDIASLLKVSLTSFGVD